MTRLTPKCETTFIVDATRAADPTETSVTDIRKALPSQYALLLITKRKLRLDQSAGRIAIVPLNGRSRRHLWKRVISGVETPFFTIQQVFSSEILSVVGSLSAAMAQSPDSGYAMARTPHVDAAIARHPDAIFPVASPLQGYRSIFPPFEFWHVLKGFLSPHVPPIFVGRTEAARGLIDRDDAFAADESLLLLGKLLWSWPGLIQERMIPLSDGQALAPISQSTETSSTWRTILDAWIAYGVRTNAEHVWGLIDERTNTYTDALAHDLRLRGLETERGGLRYLGSGCNYRVFQLGQTVLKIPRNGEAIEAVHREAAISKALHSLGHESEASECLTEPRKNRSSRAFRSIALWLDLVASALGSVGLHRAQWRVRIWSERSRLHRYALGADIIYEPMQSGTMLSRQSVESLSAEARRELADRVAERIASVHAIAASPSLRQLMPEGADLEKLKAEIGELVEDPGAEYLNATERRRLKTLIANIRPGDPVVLHNDIRPAHIMVQPDGTIRLIDYSELSIGQRFEDFAYLAVDFGPAFAIDVVEAYRRRVPSADLAGSVAMLISGLLERADMERWRGDEDAPRPVSPDVVAGLEAVIAWGDAQMIGTDPLHHR